MKNLRLNLAAIRMDLLIIIANQANSAIKSNGRRYSPQGYVVSAMINFRKIKE
jgi:hypothetical protein